MKLEIGSGSRPHGGYKTVDIEESSNPDYLGDFREMSFKDIEVIRAHHLLEHFGRKESIKVLELWHAWLKPGGMLVLETPDFKGICKAFENNPERIARHAYGFQDREWAFHKSAWWKEKYMKVLPDLGYKIKRTKSFLSKKGRVPNIMVWAWKVDNSIDWYERRLRND